MDINFELYKIFYHAASAGSFSLAARQLFISQSAVSQAIKSLEQKLGGQLFYRKSRSIRLTREGELLFKHIEQAYHMIRAGESKLNEMRHAGAGEIRIGVGDTICKYYLVPFLEKYHAAFPKVKIQIVNRTSSQILSILKAGIIDLGIVTMPVHDPSVDVVEFLQANTCFVASPKYQSLPQTALLWNDLASYPLLLLPKSSTMRCNFDAFMHSKGVAVTPEIELESVDLLIRFASIGLGIAHVLTQAADEAIQNGAVIPVQTVEQPPKSMLGIATLKKMPLSQAGANLIRILEERG